MYGCNLYTYINQFITILVGMSCFLRIQNLTHLIVIVIVHHSQTQSLMELQLLCSSYHTFLQYVKDIDQFSLQFLFLRTLQKFVN